MYGFLPISFVSLWEKKKNGGNLQWYWLASLMKLKYNHIENSVAPIRDPFTR